VGARETELTHPQRIDDSSENTAPNGDGTVQAIRVVGESFDSTIDDSNLLGEFGDLMIDPFPTRDRPGFLGERLSTGTEYELDRQPLHLDSLESA
jgi:hypothetical protein